MKKSHIQEIIDGNDNIIGYKNTPTSGANKETEASGMTDTNMDMHGQRYGSDFLGRFGFYFYEGEEKIDDAKSEKKQNLINDIAKVMYDKYINILNYYIENPKKLLDDYKLHKDHNFESQPEDKKQIDYDWAEKIIKTIKPYFDIKEDISEGEIAEDKLTDKPKQKTILSKKEKNDILDKKMNHIADLITKLDKDEKDKLINLIEKKSCKNE